MSMCQAWRRAFVRESRKKALVPTSYVLDGVEWSRVSSGRSVLDFWEGIAFQLDRCTVGLLLPLWRLGGVPCLSSGYDDSVDRSRSHLPKEQVWNSEEHAYPEEHILD
jgi:hypothetical protein